MYHIVTHGNPNNKLREYVFKFDVTVYYGKVRGGTGYQILFPTDIRPRDVLRFI